jgi:hypothetical protein
MSPTHTNEKLQMANYYTHTSFIIPLNQEQTNFAFDVLDCAQNEEIDFNSNRKNVAAKSFKTDVYKVAKKLALFLTDYELGCVSLDFTVSSDADGIWISHDETINTEVAAYFTQILLKHFDLDIGVGIEASHTCNKSHLDAFGGHAAFVTKKSVKWTDTRQWLQKQTDAFNKRLSA